MPTLPLHIFYIYFSPYTAHAIEVDEMVYQTVEHAYQCARYADENIRVEICAQRSPMKAWETSCRYKHLQIPEFKDEQYKLKVMKDLMRAKAFQHEEVAKALRESAGMEIVKHITTYPPGDGFWDDGEHGEGQNRMGRLWMEIREEI